MKKVLSIALALVMVLCLSVSAFAAGSHTVTIINGMDGSVYDTYSVADGEDFVFTISCSPPADMGPVADGEAGSGVVTTVGSIAYSSITLGGPNQYPTAETVTISGINADATVTVTPNPAEVDSQFPAITEGAAAAGASGEASGGASSEEPYPKFDEYKEYLLDTLLQDEFMKASEDAIREALDAAETPDDENILRFTGKAEVDQAPPGVVFPLSYDEWYAEFGASGEPSGEGSSEPAGSGESLEDAFIEYIHEWLIAEDEINDTMTEEVRENEFMPLVRQMDFETYPADMIYNGMLEQGVPMTFEEFAAQYTG